MEEDEPVPLLVYTNLHQFQLLDPDQQDIHFIDAEWQHLILHDNPALFETINEHYYISQYHEGFTNENSDWIYPLPFRTEFSSHTQAEEHQEPFYQKWSKQQAVKLFKTNHLLLDLILETGNEEITLCQVEGGHYVILEEEDRTKIYYNIKYLTLEGLVERLEEDEQNAYELESLIQQKDRTMAMFYNAMSAGGDGGLTEEQREIFNSLMQEGEQQNQRKEILDEIQEEQRYSYDWFEKYLRLLLTYEQKDNSLQQKSIQFQKIKQHVLDGKPSQKYFMLEGASSVIPMHIEDYDDFQIKLVFRKGKPEFITIEGVGKRGQDLLVYVRQGLSPKLIQRLKEVVQIEISFTPQLDLLQRLYDAFTTDWAMEHWEVIEDTLPPIHFIYGPPGTGKTTTICNIVDEAVAKSPTTKCLMLLPTNKAADVLVKKALEINPNIVARRIGKVTDPELEELDEDIYLVNPEKDDIENAHIVASTVHRFPYFKIRDAQATGTFLFAMEDQWDYVIFDEASMTNLPYIVFGLMVVKRLNRNAKCIVAGDPKQIPPVIDVNDAVLESLETGDVNIYKMLGINSFVPEEQQLREQDTIENLPIQYRSVFEIGKLFSQFSYGDLLEHHRQKHAPPPKKLPQEFLPMFKDPVTQIDFGIDVDEGVLRPKKLLKSSYHIYAGILAAEIVKYFDDCNAGKQQWTVGLISPYKAQAVITNKLVTSYGISESVKVYCDTVHGFQGDECDIILFMVNPNNTYYTGYKNSLLSKHYLYNVAISRARDYLWILSPFDVIRNHYVDKLSEIRAAIIGNKVVVSSKKLEKLMFNQSDFIVKNSYVTGHDNINIFGQTDMTYFIKASDTAVDIQLRKLTTA